MCLLKVTGVVEHDCTKYDVTYYLELNIAMCYIVDVIPYQANLLIFKIISKQPIWHLLAKYEI